MAEDDGHVWWPRKSGESRQNEGKKMSRYLLNDEVCTEEFYVMQESNGELTIKDDISQLPEEEQKKYTKEWIKYKVPSWNEIANITEMAASGMSPFPSQQIIDRSLLLLYLHEASFFEIKRGVPEDSKDSPEQVLNAENLLGPKGVVPTLINKVLLVLRRRM